MPTLQCEFWNVGQGLFSSGRIQMLNEKEQEK